jgi:hypothetical protein
MNRIYRIQNGARKANIHRHPVHPVNPVNPVKIRFFSPFPFGEHAVGEAEISAQKPTVFGRFHGQAVLQRRVLDCLPAVLSPVALTKGEARSAKEGTPAEIDRPL